MKFSIKDLLSGCDEIHIFLRIWSHLLMKFLMENFIFCAVPPQDSFTPRLALTAETRDDNPQA